MSRARKRGSKGARVEGSDDIISDREHGVLAHARSLLPETVKP